MEQIFRLFGKDEAESIINYIDKLNVNYFFDLAENLDTQPSVLTLRHSL